MSHTPGPWFVEFSSTLGNRIVHGAMSESGFRDDVPMDPGDAGAVDNLTLAAAAPELLEALSEAIPLMQAAQRKALLSKSMAAISKATGGGK
jgi:hypothetical protein